MAEIVTASLTINFDAGKGNNQFLGEVDDRPDGPNAGRTQFRPGDTVHLLLFASPQITGINGRATSGSLSAGGLVTVEKEEIISFAEEGEASSRYPINPGSATFEWYGPAPTSITYADGRFVVPPTTFAVGKVTYRSTARAYSLSGVSFPAALILWTGKAP